MMQMLVSVLLFIIFLIPGFKVHVRKFKSTFNAINVQLTYSVPSWELKLPSKFVLPLWFQFHFQFERNCHSIDVGRDKIFQWTMRCGKWAAKASRDDIASQIVYSAYCDVSKKDHPRRHSWSDITYTISKVCPRTYWIRWLQKNPGVNKSHYCQ